VGRITPMRCIDKAHNTHCCSKMTEPIFVWVQGTCIRWGSRSVMEMSNFIEVLPGIKSRWVHRWIQLQRWVSYYHLSNYFFIKYHNKNQLTNNWALICKNRLNYLTQWPFCNRLQQDRHIMLCRQGYVSMSHRKIWMPIFANANKITYQKHTHTSI